MNTIFGASSMFNNQPPAANRQFREDVARLLPCGVHATARNRARPIPFPSRMGPPPHAFRFSAVSPLRGPQRGKQLVRIPRQRLLASFHPSLRRLALARGVVRHVAHYGQVFRRDPAPGPRTVLVEDHVEHPVQRILHVPVRAGGLQGPFGIDVKRRDEIAFVPRGRARLLAERLGLDPRDAP